jgi:hypothetical protein
MRLRVSIKTLALANFVGCLGVLAPIGGTSLAAAPAGAYCGKLAIARDYLQSLRMKAPVREPSPSGKMPFAPRGMTLVKKGDGLVVNRGWVGFSIRDGAVQQLRHLNWVIETELSRVNSRGRVVDSRGVKRRQIGSIEGNQIRDLLYWLSGEPAFYRVDIRFFRKCTSRLLGEYSSYARVMKSRVDLRVVVDTLSVFPGEFATARLVNLGTVAIRSNSISYGFGVEAFTGETWIPMPDNLSRRSEGPRIKVKQVLPAGMELRNCLRYLVPEDQMPGLFRFASSGAWRGKVLAGGFEVKAGS